MRERAFGLAGVGVVVASLAWGCGGGSGGASSATPSAFCAEYIRRYDQAQYACGGGVGNDPSPPSSKCAHLDAALARGDISFTPDTAAACLGTLAKTFDPSCLVDPPCIWDVIDGHVAEGAPCESWIECGADAVCAGPPEACGPKVCVKTAPAPDSTGAACSLDAPCPFGYRCDIPPAGVEGTCVASTLNGGCTNTFDCLFIPQYCDQDTCKPRIPIGGSCVDHADGCVVLGACDPTTQKCVVAGLLGRDCGPLISCWAVTCETDDTSPSFGKCVPRKPAGGVCDQGTACASGACDPATMKCLACP